MKLWLKFNYCVFIIIMNNIAEKAVLKEYGNLHELIFSYNTSTPGELVELDKLSQ